MWPWTFWTTDGLEWPVPSPARWSLSSEGRWDDQHESCQACNVFASLHQRLNAHADKFFAFYCRYALFSNYCYSHTFSMGVQENTHIHPYTEQLRMLLSCTWQFWNRERQKNIGEQNVCVRAGGARVDEGAVWQQAGDVWSGAGEDSTHGSSSVCHWGTVRSLVSLTKVSVNWVCEASPTLASPLYVFCKK